MAMHDDELHIDEQVARRLITEQFPEWRLEYVRRIATGGTVNAIFRIGADLTARFPLRSADPTDMREELAREAAVMRQLAAYCPVLTPSPVAMGDPGFGYPLPWTVQTWIHGTVSTPQGSAHSELFAQDLANLVRSLRAADTKGRHFAGSGRVETFMIPTGGWKSVSEKAMDYFRSIGFAHCGPNSGACLMLPAR